MNCPSCGASIPQVKTQGSGYKANSGLNSLVKTAMEPGKKLKSMVRHKKEGRKLYEETT